MEQSILNTISRRNFIRLSGMTGAVLALGFSFGCDGNKDSATLENISDIDPDTAKELTPFILIDSKGTIVLITHKPEMGQGTFQSMPLIVAEELGVTLDQVLIKPAIADKKYGSMTVGGSNSVRGSWTLLREAGAAAREMLLLAAANKWGVPVQECEVEQDKVHHLNTHRMFAYGELVEEASKLEVPKQPKLKDPSKFVLVGQSVPRPDILQKVEGKAGFGIDAKLDGMLYISVERCPFFGGKVKSFDESEAKKIPGVKQVLIAERKSGKNIYYGVAVAAETYHAALQGRKALKVEWDLAGVEQESTEKIYQRFHDLAKTAFLSEFILFKSAVILYWVNLSLLGQLLGINWRYANKNNLLSITIEEKSTVTKTINRRIIESQLLYTLAVLLCFVNTYISIGLLVLIQLNYALAIFSKPGKKLN